MAHPNGGHPPPMKTASALGSAGFAAILAMFGAACGITVIVPGQTSDVTGTGAGAGGSGVASGDGSGPTGVGGNSTGSGDMPPVCDTTCSVPPSGETCTCTANCGSQAGGTFEKINCAPITDLQGNHKVECVCSVQDFSGVCFEKNLANLCNFDDGCCAKYFTGK
jgi:hypothetical protein